MFCSGNVEFNELSPSDNSRKVLNIIQLILILINLKHKNSIVVNMNVHINFC